MNCFLRIHEFLTPGRLRTADEFPAPDGLRVHEFLLLGRLRPTSERNHRP